MTGGTRISNKFILLYDDEKGLATKYNQNLDELADFHAKYMREAVLERMEDEDDYNDAMANLKASHGETVSSAEIHKRLGLS
ncbi:hypothetical protein CHT97_10075 [Lacticaseibacillus chiayiensis]|nr:hypothetical protein CHT97_10075 [Lacticaseibacillus chiayiensis]